jgi:hypothetical protein
MRNVMAVLFVCLLSATTLAGITRTYEGGTSWSYGWDIATNWSPNGVPEAGDTVTIGGNRKVIIGSPENGLNIVYVAYTSSTAVTQGYLRICGAPNYPAFSGALGANTIYVSYVGGSTGFIDQQGGTVTVNNLTLTYTKGTGSGDY